MKRWYLFFVSFLIIMGILFSSYSIFLSLKFYGKPDSLTTRASSQGRLTFIVESPDSSSPVVSSSSSSDGGGGGGGVKQVASKITDFNVNPTELNLQIVSGESITKEIFVENLGSDSGKITINVSGISQYVGSDKDSLTLGGFESSMFLLSIDAPEPGIYPGKLIFSSGLKQKEVLVLLNVVSKDVLFDVSLTIPDYYNTILVGDNLPTLIEILNIGGDDGLDVSLNYTIKDFDGNLISSESEVLYIQGSKSFDKVFKTLNLENGDYVAGIELTYPGGFATASAHFRVSKTKVNYKTLLALILSIIALLIVLFSILYYRKSSNEEKNRKMKK